VTPLIKAALAFRGTALLDIISPCVTFNDKDDSTKSYAWGKAHDERINDFSFVAAQDEITIEQAPGETKEVTMHDGSRIVLKKLDGKHDPTDKYAAMRLLEEAREKQHFITGLLYLNDSRPNLAEYENLGATPLAQLPESKTRPSRASLEKLIAGMK
jgi:2-oxoglutarate ferredoxin oxidoreductase subunit beta